MSRSVGVVVPAYRPDVDRLSRYVRDLDERLAPAELRIELDDPGPGDREALADLPAT
ncbi:dolichol-P-glucose transferase, partial [Halolamina salina]